MQGDQAYISYYSFDTRPAGSTQNDVFNPLAACFVKAQTGVGENIQYFDVNSTYALPDASHAAPFRFEPATVIDATKYASALVGEWWIFYAQKSSGSASLSYFIRVVYSGFFGKADLSSTSIAANFEAYTRALYSMALLKMLNTENFYHRDPAWVAISNGTFGGTADVPVFANYATSVRPSASQMLHTLTVSGSGGLGRTRDRSNRVHGADPARRGRDARRALYLPRARDQVRARFPQPP